MSNRGIVWIFNAFVAVLCVLSILCYFFAPAWQVGVTYKLDAETMRNMMGGDTEINVEEVVGDGVDISGTLTLGGSDLVGFLFGGSDTVVEQIVNSNVGKIVDELSGTINAVARKVVKSVAKESVKKEVKNNVKKYLTSRGSEDETVEDAEVEKKLEELGFTDDYIAEKTDSIVDSIFEGGATDTDQIADNIMDTVHDVYDDFQKKSTELKEQGVEGYEDFEEIELTEETEAEIRSAIEDTLKDLAAEDGTIDPDELIAELLAKALGGDKSEAKIGIELLAATNLAEEAPSEEEVQSASDKLKATVSSTIMGYVQPASTYVSIALRAMGGLILFSMLPWIYILIKLLVKLLRRDPNPTVKLALPIWLGWLFYLLFAGIPGLAIALLPTLMSSLTFLPAEAADILGRLSMSVSSIAWITAISALLCFFISIFYMVMRRKFKQERKNGQFDGRDAMNEAAYSD